MTERVLAYDRSIVPQETGYWCGPASTQVVLNGRGIVVGERELANQLGTTTSGTNYVGLIERALDQRVPDARYTSVYLETDPPSQQQKDRLWVDIVHSIDAGYGVVMNWVAPPSNKPRGVKGSPTPSYSGGTTYHYVACMGYDDNPAARALWIADSGFRPFGYWISFDQAATLIPPKGYAYAAADVTAPAPPSVVSPPPAAATIFGPDISNNNGVVDLDRVKAEGFEFLFAKVSEGAGFRDRFWPATRDWAQRIGLILAGYHYVRTDDPQRQADTFVSQLGDDDVPAMLDFEAGSGGIGNFWAVKAAIEARGVRVALSYIPRWYWEQIGRPDLSGVPGLIQSSYVNGTGYASTLYPGDGSSRWAGFGGRTPDLLQFTDKASIAGKSLDANAFRGTPDQLRELLGQSTQQWNTIYDEIMGAN